MAGGFSIDLVGDKELADQFRTMPDKIQASLLRTSFRDALKPVLAQAKALARKKSGAMARTLRIKTMKRKKGRVGLFIRTGTLAELGKALAKRGITRTVRRKSKAKGRQGYYPAHIELGTKRNPAYPYLRPAFDAGREGMIAKVAESMNQALDEAV